MPTHTLIQLTDLHIGPHGPREGSGIDTHPILAHALRVVEGSGLRPTALVLTGDLADHGSAQEYRRVRALVEPVAARLGAPVVYVAGNHDDRARLREHLLDAEDSTAPLDQVVRLGDLRIVALDSTVPGYAHGELSPAQLDWLRAELATPAAAGTVLALHHPPLPSPSPLTASMELQNRADLGAAIAGSDVRIVLAGHTHVVSAGAIAGVPVWTGGAAPFLSDALAPDNGARTLRMPTISRIDLFDDAVLATAVPLEGEQLAFAPAAAVAAETKRMRAQLPRR